MISSCFSNITNNSFKSKKYNEIYRMFNMHYFNEKTICLIRNVEKIYLYIQDIRIVTTASIRIGEILKLFFAQSRSGLDTNLRSKRSGSTVAESNKRISVSWQMRIFLHSFAPKEEDISFLFLFFLFFFFFQRQNKKVEAHLEESFIKRTEARVRPRIRGNILRSFKSF